MTVNVFQSTDIDSIQPAQVDFPEIYQQIHEKINSLLTAEGDEAIKQSIKKNVDLIRSWLPATKEKFDGSKRLHLPAVQALETALSILNIVEQLTTSYQRKTPTTGSKSFTSQVFSGAHLLIDDNGALLQHLRNQINLINRFSSHYRNEKIALFKEKHKATYQDIEQLEKAAVNNFNQGTPDFSIRAELIFNELLLGEVIIDNKTYTWMQFEGHSHQPRTAYQNSFLQLLDNLLQTINYSIEKFHHHLDYVKYRFHGKKLNIGQYGNSEYTESNPLQLIVQEQLSL